CRAAGSAAARLCPGPLVCAPGPRLLVSQTASHWEVRIMTRSLLSWLRGGSGRKSARRPAHRRRGFLPPVLLLEDRTLLSVQFTPAPYAVPANRPDTPLTRFQPYGGFVEPYLSVNPADPGDIAVSSADGIRVSTTAGGSFTGTTRFSDSTG